MTAFIKELRDFYYFFKLPKSKKQIVFYAEHEGYNIYFEGIIRELIERHGQNICYITSDITDPILKALDKRIIPLYLNKLLAFFMPLVDCKVVVMTLTDLGNSYLKRSRNPVHYVYVFHALISTHMVYNNHAFNNYDSILCAGPHHITEIRKHEEIYNLKSKRLIEAGYYRLEKTYDEYKKYYNKKTVTKNRQTVLVAPSWGRHNILELCGKKLIRTLLTSGYKVIARPHPETLKRSPCLIKEIELDFGSNPNFFLEKSVASNESLLNSDVLICDYSGTALEYAFGTERPVLFLDVPPKVHNVNFRELGIEPIELLLRSQIGKVLPPTEIDSIPEVISELIAEESAYKEKIVEMRGKSVFAFGHSSKVGAEYIMSLL